MTGRICVVCGSAMRRGASAWHWQCATCGYEAADLAPSINEATAHERIDEASREAGLRSLRSHNFDRLLAAIGRHAPAPGSVLDVGCAHGWFLDAARARGYRAAGIEPDANVFRSASARGLAVRQGLFPDVLSPAERFDVIAFNDVFEHIPDARAVLAACGRHLNAEGVLALNLPSSSGAIYRFARVLSRLGWGSFFDRLWQKGLPSPHVHYFDPGNLKALLEANGFEVVASGRLSTIRLRGLFTRVSYTGQHSLVMRLLICVAVALAIPLLSIVPADIVYVLSRRGATAPVPSVD